MVFSSSYSWYQPRRRRLVDEELKYIFKLGNISNSKDAAAWVVQNTGGDKQYGKVFRPFGTHNYMYGFDKTQLVKLIFDQAHVKNQSIELVMYNEDQDIFRKIGAPQKPTPGQIIQFVNIWAQDLERVMGPINTIAPWVTLGAVLISGFNFGGFFTLMALVTGIAATEAYSYTQGYANTGMSIEQFLFFGMFLFSKPKWTKISFLMLGRLYALFEIATSLISDPPLLAKYGNGKRVGHIAHAASVTLGALLVRYS